MPLLHALALTVVVVLSGLSLALSWTSRRDLRKLLSAFGKAHPNGGYPGPSAVVTEGREASPAPVSGRVPVVALPSVARSVVSITRDDDPIHTRATVAAPQPGRTRDLGETTRNMLRLVSSDERSAARESWTEAHGDRPALESLRVTIEAEDDRPTPEGETMVFSSDDAALRARPALALVARSPEDGLVLGTDLNDVEAARVDALAARLGMTRDALVAMVTRSGISAIEAQQAQRDKPRK